jgi:hypothetical protein
MDGPDGQFPLRVEELARLRGLALKKRDARRVCERSYTFGELPAELARSLAGKHLLNLAPV